MSVTVKTTAPRGNRSNASAGQQNQQQFKAAAAAPQIGLANRLSGLGSGGDTFEKLFDQINAKVRYLNEEMRTEEKYAAIKLLKQNAGLNYSAILVSETLNDVTAVHILMVERTGEYPESVFQNVSGVRYEFARTPADALDEKYIQQALLATADALKVDVSTVTVVDGTLVPSEFDVSSEVAVEDLLNNALNAVFAEIQTRVQDYQGLNLKDLLSNASGTFNIGLHFNQDDTTVVDQTGMPVRQDICIALSYKLNQQFGQTQSVNQGSDSVDIVKTYGYIEMEWAPPRVVGQTQKFVPNFVITHVSSKSALTPDLIALSLASVASLNEDMNWMQAFRPRAVSKGTTDYNDIGALNIEGNLEGSPTGYGAKVDTKSKTFSVVELNKLVQTLVHPDFLVSIDLPKAGPDTWYMSLLRAIKFQGDQGAMGRMSSALATLTSGSFGSAAPMFVDITNKIHGGYYRTKDGIRDLRHLSSYLAIANFISETSQSPALISQFTNTLYNTSVPSELRVSERKKYLDDMSGKTAVYKQTYDRVTINGQWLVDMVGSLKMSGFRPMYTNMTGSNDIFQRRGTVDFSSALVGRDLRVSGQDNQYGSINVGYAQYQRNY